MHGAEIHLILRLERLNDLTPYVAPENLSAHEAKIDQVLAEMRQLEELHEKA